MAATSVSVLDYAGATKTFSEVQDPNNSSYLCPKVIVDDSLRLKATFSCGGSSYAPYATPTDVITIIGSATKTVRLKKVRLTATSTSGGTMPVLLIKRSADNTGGTRATQAAYVAKHDSSLSAQSAVVYAYSVIPDSLGASAGYVGAQRLVLGTAAAGGRQAEWIWGEKNDMCPVLRGVTEVLSVNLGGNALTSGGVLDWEIVWEEDAS